MLTRACTVAPARVPSEGGSTQRRGGSKADRTAAGSGAVPAILSVLGVAVVGAIVGGAVPFVGAAVGGLVVGVGVGGLVMGAAVRATSDAEVTPIFAKSPFVNCATKPCA